MTDTNKSKGSVLRLRIGLVLLLLWMLPFWMLGPYIAESANLGSAKGASISATIAIIQTVIGIIGAVVAGKEVTGIVKGTKLRNAPKKIWVIFWNGGVE